jgi:glycosyltransferase involved in cell wall biosynthesis
VKVLIASTFEHSGGAARSAHRLFQQLNRIGVDCRMLVQYKQSDDPKILAPEGWLEKKFAALRPYMDALPLLSYRTRLSPPWSLAWLPKNIAAEVAGYSPDVIHLHGTGHGFLPISTIKRFSTPLVWTLHDSWAFTGGCHLPGGCIRYLRDCGRCPQLNMRHENDLSRWVWRRKSYCWPQLNVSFVAPSRWIAGCAYASSLLASLPIEVIPNGIDTSRFTPGNRTCARAALGLPQEGSIMLYGASSFTSDKNKGFVYLQSALSSVKLSLPKKNLTLVLFGDHHYRVADLAGIPVRSFGPILSDDQIISLYRAADLFILPSLQENLPNTVMEAMACGVPCVVFAVGGIVDLIEPGANGYIARAADVRELAEGIKWMLADDGRCAMLGRQARKTIEAGFSIAEVADRHLALYERIIVNNR